MQNIVSSMGKNKKGGIIRKGALVPFILVNGAIIALTILFLDPAIESGLEFGLSRAVGAKVDVADVNTSFSELSLEINGIQIPNLENLEENTIYIGRIFGNVSWDALLRAKVLIPKINVGKIALYQKRKSKAELLPVEPEEDKKANEIKKQVLGAAKKKNSGNFIGDLADAAESGDMGDVKLDNLGSQQKINKTKDKIEAQKAKVEALIKDLPSPDELNDLQKEIQNFPYGDLGNLAKAQKTIKELNKLKKKTDQTLKKYKKVEKEIKKTLKLSNELNIDVKELVKEDLEDLKKQANIPSLDTDSLARTIFGEGFANNIQKAKKYYSYIEEYLPPKKDKDDKPSFSKAPRALGRDYQFGTPKSYPLFWIQEVIVDSEASNPTQVKGTIENITSNQRVIKSSTTGQLLFSDQKMNIRGGVFAFDIDHRKKPKAGMKLFIKEFKTQNKVIINSPDAKFKMAKANLETKNSVVVENGIFNIESSNDFTNITYANEAKNEEVLSLLNGVSQVSPKLKVDAKAKGKIDNLKISLSSNLAKAFNKSLNLMFDKKIKALEAKYKKEIEDKIQTEKKKIDAQLAQVKAQADQAMGKVNKEIDKLNDKMKSEEKKAKKGAQKNLLKGLKL
jgi:uncharacterized protein (TIGR03545 family)